ncbi:MAG: DUF192 domain-containing protein [Heliobacteriaceae bacterium]|nr:DUF192 domain-containing protein [Heliobacteriaceae bacterium]MDD4586782.1 DUF192 domain-containing protein [Heliobacteriaceae bacterium]
MPGPSASRKLLSGKIISPDGKVIPVFKQAVGKGTLITVEVADTFWTRLRGLLGRSHLPPGYALLLAPCNQIHTLGMRFPLDVLYLDQANVILEMEIMVKPGRIQRARRQAAKVVEFQGSTLNPGAIATGNRLFFE